MRQARSGQRVGATDARDPEVRSRVVVQQFATPPDSSFYSSTPGLAIQRTLLVHLEVRFCDISVAFIHTLMPKGEPVSVAPPVGLYDCADTVGILKRVLNSLREASRLFHEHLAHILTPQ